MPAEPETVMVVTVVTEETCSTALAETMGTAAGTTISAVSARVASRLFMAYPSIDLSGYLPLPYVSSLPQKPLEYKAEWGIFQIFLFFLRLDSTLKTRV
jgi:hypothetical protein